MPDAVVLFTGIVVFAQMFDVGLRYRPGEAGRFLRDHGLVLRALASALLAVPLAVFVLIAVLPLPAEVALGLVLLAAAPGAPLTTRRSEAAGAARDVVAPLQLTLAALAMIHMPLVLSAFEGVLDPPGFDVAPELIARQVATVTFVPLALGMLVARAVRGTLERHTRLLSAAAKALFLAFLAAILLALTLLPDLRATFLIGWVGAGAALALAALALAFGHALGGTGAPHRAGVAIATVARNLGLALYVAESAEATLGAIPTILTYAALSLVLAVPYSRWIRRRIELEVTVSGGASR
jgi:BASS family bile acid:Na+ symporter